MKKSTEKKLEEKIEMLEKKIDLLALQLELAKMSNQPYPIYVGPAYIPDPIYHPYHPYGYPTITCGELSVNN
jgi:hypothetical protein